MASGVTSTAAPDAAESYLLPSVAAAVIGGTSIFGGRGGYAGTLVGALILTVLASLLTVLRAPEPVRIMVYGAIILVVAAAYTRITSEFLRPMEQPGDRAGTWASTWVSRTSSGPSSSGPRTTGGRSTGPRWPPHAIDGPESVVGRLVETARRALEAWPAISSVGVGVPGLYDPAAGTTRFLVNMPGDWAGRRGRAALGRTALRLPTFLTNDARAFGLAELRLGAGRGADCMVGLTLGTGVGGVIVVDGRVHQGHDGTAGEIGHQTIDPDGPWCNCGNRGCLEAFARADQIAHACGTDDGRGGGATRRRWETGAPSAAWPTRGATWASASAT